MRNTVKLNENMRHERNSMANKCGTLPSYAKHNSLFNKKAVGLIA